MTQDYGPLDPLYEAVRARAPQVEAARVHCGLTTEAERNEPMQYVRVSYRTNGPRRVVWDTSLGAYRWDSGPHSGVQLGPDADVAAVRIAHALGASFAPAPAAE
ncbi:hypothetical protein [Actinomadura chibensis]|uniref:Uncharacterized protein n=1 Tax=Actinomadura chibensis TaxID=392828 RepID=A0A5D0NPB5_9ACTN|nr:hypothetical protein [Actinomadura chibensis]TYB46222.1 hypothetical protein FXF69_13165 [Actinomadura chibensis]